MKINPRFIPLPDMNEPANISKLAEALLPELQGDKQPKLIKVLAIKIGPATPSKTDPLEIPQITNAPMRPGAKFPLGKVIATRLVREKICPMCVGEAIKWHSCGKWGEVSRFDAMANEDALKTGRAILSVYTCGGGGKFYVMTNPDRSVTTVMMPEET